MFKSFKEKLGKLFKKQEEVEKEIPETQEVVDEKIEETQEEKQDIEEKLEKAEEKIKKIQQPETEYSLAHKDYLPNLDKTAENIEKKAEQDKKDKKVKKKLKKEIQKKQKQREDDLKKQIQELEEKEKKLEQEIQEEAKKYEPEHKSFFSKVKGKFSGEIILNQETFEEFFEHLEQLLLENNVALEVVDKIKEDLEKELVNTEITKNQLEEKVKQELAKSIENTLIPPFDLIEKINEKKEPFVILFFGINGSGKTTTISKVANLLKQNKIPCVLAAGDTFRAASIEQLKKHAENLGIKVISSDYGADPASVGFDAIQYATSHGIKAVLIDTAGRMHTKSDLLREMEKIVRVTKPDLKIFVAESITGNDAIEQAKAFNETAELDASILTKADVDEKGGTAISIGYVTKKPILYLGTGQKYKDLEKFDPREIIHKLGLD